MTLSRKNILRVLGDAGEPMTLAEIGVAFGISGKKGGEQVLSHLNALIKSGTIIRNRRNRFALSDRMDMVTGRVVGHREGFGFVSRAGEGPDLYLSSREMQRVLHSDKVLARVKNIDSRGRHEGAVVSLLEQGPHHLVGRFVQDRGIGFVVPDDSRFSQDVVVHSDDQGAARDGMIVVVEITTHPFEHRRLGGRIIECIGEHLAPGMETEIAIRKHEIPWEWPEEVTREVVAGDFSDAGVVPEEGRTDLRHVPLVTIDGADARDFDDAVAARRENSGWTLWVAIADVSRYVVPGGELDMCAARRGNSVYFPGRVIPMLPEVLSNGICSLKPNVDRYSLVCEMRIASGGVVDDYRFFPAIIRSRARLTYEKAQSLIDGDTSARASVDGEALESVDTLRLVFDALRRKRFADGSLDLEIAEPVFVFGADRRIESVRTRTRLDAHRLIEECMLAANVCAARFISSRGDGGMYRVHDEPDGDRLSDLRRVYGVFGVRVSGGATPSAADLMSAVEDARERRPDVSETMQMLVLRTMKQAVYSADPSLHYALGFTHYTHFTSPIRRYPDLVVHRLIKQRLGFGPRLTSPEREQLEETADHCSMTERRAEEATRDVYQWLKAEYMQEHIGEEFDGRVSAVTQFGVFVTLDEIYIDGLVHISELGADYFRFDPVRLELNGERSGRTIRLGDALRVQVAGVDLDEGHVSFVPAVRDGRRRKSGKWDRVPE
ncbi:MAG: ribonuclease R [Proteobacteria bacterium]|nr:MAG: ribonuclease R [Pseudomonadota bacterium]